MSVTKTEGKENEYTFTMPASKVTVSATFTKKAYNIKTNVTNGTVTAQVGGKTATTATMGDKVTLTPVPNPGYELDGKITVTGGGVTLGADNTFTMPASDVTVTANFKVIPPSKYNITIEKNENGTITSSAASATAGTPITLIATPNPGYALDVVTVTGTGSGGAVKVDGTDNTRTFAMPSYNVTVTATFKKVSYNIKLVDNGFGTVTADRTTATIGDTVTLTLAAKTGCELDKLAVTPSGAVSLTKVNDTTYTFVMPASDVTVTAAFTQIMYPISVSSNKVTVKDDMTETFCGDAVELTVHPGANEKVEPAVNDGAVPCTKTGDNTYVFIMPASGVEVTAKVTSL